MTQSSFRISPALKLCAVILICCFFGVNTCFAAPSFPTLSGRVVDNANLMSSAEQQQISSKLADFEQKTTAQIVVVTLQSLQGYEVRDFGYQLGRHWGIGQKDKNNGVLLIVAPIERKLAIEVGYGLEGDLTDALSKLIIEHRIIPHFKNGDYGSGIIAGVDSIIAVLSKDGSAQELTEEFSQEDDISPLVVFILIFVLFIILNNMSGGGGGRRRRSGWTGHVGGGWSGGSGGGGFSGGGGGFGGGGASGGW